MRCTGIVPGRKSTTIDISTCSQKKCYCLFSRGSVKFALGYICGSFLTWAAIVGAKL